MCNHGLLVSGGVERGIGTAIQNTSTVNMQCVWMATALALSVLLLPALAHGAEEPPRWEWLGVGRSAGTKLPWNDPKIPDELDAEWKDGGGKIEGKAAIDSRLIGGQQLSWFGKELRWEIASAEDVSSRLTLLSRVMGAVGDRGPKGNLQVIDRTGKTILKRVLLTGPHEIVYLRMSGPKLTTYDLSGRDAQTASNVQFPLTVGFSVLLKNAGEECDTHLRWEKHVGPVPVVPGFDPVGEPKGLLTGQPSRYYVWHEGNHWHLRSTSRKFINFRGIVRVLNGQVGFVRPIGFEKSQKDSWAYDAERREIRFACKTGPSFDGLDFRIEGRNAFVEFEIHHLGRGRPGAIFIGPEQKNPPGVPFAFPAKPALKK